MNRKNPKIAIIGLGYVGLPLAVEFGNKYDVVGYDNDASRISHLKLSIDKTNEISKKKLEDTTVNFSSSINSIVNADVYIITVPTPVDKNNNPNLEPLKSATSEIGSVLNKGNVVIFESTVYPGCTEEICVPILEKQSKLKFNSEFFCGYSPERINPGDKKNTLVNIKKVTSGSNPQVADFVDYLYNQIIHAGTHKASSISVAEAAKIIENTQRDVNIALINELALIFDKLKIDTNEVLEAASTKWNFLNFKPGLVGGHCIGVDPYYLTHKATEMGYHPEMILAGRKLNDNMGYFIAENTIKELTKKSINPIGAKVAILGITFKENCPDTRNTKVYTIIEKLKHYGCEIEVSDYWAHKKDIREGIQLIDLKDLREQDALVIAVNHSTYSKFQLSDIKKILKKGGVVIDVKSIFDKNYFKGSEFTHWRL